MKSLSQNLNTPQTEASMHTKGPLLIVAGAGAGKTKTITHRILNLIKGGVNPENILAITFTNKAAKEMRERLFRLLSEDETLNRPISSSERPFVSTFHALGVHIIKENSKLLSIPRYFNIFDRNDSVKAVRQSMEYLSIDTKQFEPSRILSIISKEKGSGISFSEFSSIGKHDFVGSIVKKVWEKYENILTENKALDFDDLLLKTLNLLKENPDVRGKYSSIWQYIHIDEYQDTNIVQYQIAKLLAEKHKNICVVGDIDQCLVAGTRIEMSDGSRRPIEKIKTGDAVMSNYGSGDFRSANVAKIFSRQHRGDLIEIKTKGGNRLISTPEHTHFAGYRLGETPQKYFTYIMYKENFGWRLGTSQVYTNGQRSKVVGFIQRSNQEHADTLWILKAHDTPNAARILEYTISLQYGIPTLPFVARKGKGKGGYVHDQEAINAIFASVRNDKKVADLLKHYGLSINHPHHRPQSRNSNRRNILIALCGDRRGKSPMHRISMIGNDYAGREILRRGGFSVRPAKKNSSGWRFEKANADFKIIQNIAEKIQVLFPKSVTRHVARLGLNKKKSPEGNSLSFMQASAIREGMVMFDKKGNYDIVTNVRKLKNQICKVYDLNIERTHNFIANEIITHNSIYSWRGADFKNITRFEKDYQEAKVIILEQNYRSTKTILEAANMIISKNIMRKEKNLFTENENGEKISLYGAYDESDEAYFVANKARQLVANGISPKEIAVLYRANFQSRILEEAFLSEKVPYQVLGVRFFERKEVKDILSYLRAALEPENIIDIKRIINSPARGIGKITILKVFSGQESDLPQKTRDKISDFRKILSNINKKIETSKTSEAVLYTIVESGMKKELESGKNEDLERLENLSELVSLSKKYDFLEGRDGIERLLTDAALATDQDDMKEDLDAVKLMTVHASKGLEFEYVFITGLEDDLFPHRKPDGEKKNKEETEEERRLFYVALTRAKKKLFLSYASVRTIFGLKRVSAPSEFLEDIDETLMENARQDNAPRGKIIYLE